MITGSWPKRSSRQAAPESASHVNSQSSHLCDTKSAAGAAIQKLRQLKQSISLPIRRSPSHTRNRTMISAGPSSLASRCVTRQVARTATANRVQRSKSRKASTLQIVADANRPECLCPVWAAREDGSILDPQPEDVIATLPPWQ